MAEALKNVYNQQFLAGLCGYIKPLLPDFPETDFIRSVQDKNWKNRELKDRMRHISITLNQYLPGSYRQQLKVITGIARQMLKEKPTQQSFPYLILADFIEQFGQDHLTVSLSAMEIVTQVTSCEFAIRPFIKRYPEEVMAQMLLWAKHPNPNVRRFSSEGCRPRLPWGMVLPDFIADPAPILPILEILKTDSSEYVRKSVANNLNDISKDHPEIVRRIATRWYGTNKDVNWVVKHAVRTLLKKGDPAMLGLFGHAHDTPVSAKDLRLSAKSIAIGDQLEFSFAIRNDSEETLSLRVEYFVYYRKARGHAQKKIFKISESRYAPGKWHTIQRKHSFRDLTTRKHHPGKHTLAIVVNGKELIQKDFDLQ